MVQHITVKHEDELYHMDIWGSFVCNHKRAYVIKPCCPIGTLDCCFGMKEVVCPNVNCTGMTEEYAINITGQMGNECYE